MMKSVDLRLGTPCHVGTSATAVGTLKNSVCIYIVNEGVSACESELSSVRVTGSWMASLPVGKERLLTLAQ